MQVEIPDFDIRVFQRLQIAAFEAILVIGAIDHTTAKLQVCLAVQLQAGVVGKRVDVVAVVKRFLFAPFDLIVEAVKLALFVSQAPVIVRPRIADGTEGSQVPPRAPGNLELGATGVSRVPGNDVDGAEKRINAVGGRVWAPGYFDTLNHLQRHRHGFPVHIRQGGPVSGAAIHQNLHAALLVVNSAVVSGYRCVAANKIDHHARHQAEHFVQVNNAQVANQVAIDHGGAAGNPGFWLA